MNLIAKSSLSLIDFDNVGNYIKTFSYEFFMDVRLARKIVPYNYLHCIINRTFEKLFKKSPNRAATNFSCGYL